MRAQLDGEMNEIIVENSYHLISYSTDFTDAVSITPPAHAQEKISHLKIILSIIKANKAQRIILPYDFRITFDLNVEKYINMVEFTDAIQENTALLNIECNNSDQMSIMTNKTKYPSNLSVLPTKLYSCLKKQLQVNQLKFLTQRLENGATFLDLTTSDFDRVIILDAKAADEFIIALSKSTNLSEVALSNFSDYMPVSSMSEFDSNILDPVSFRNKILATLATLPNLSRVRVTWSQCLPPTSAGDTSVCPAMNLRKTCFLNQMKKIEGYRGDTLKFGTDDDAEIHDVFYLDLELLTGTSELNKACAKKFFEILNKVARSGNIQNIYVVNFENLSSSHIMLDRFFDPLKSLCLAPSLLRSIRFPKYFYHSNDWDPTKMSINDERYTFVDYWRNTVLSFTGLSYLARAFGTLSRRMDQMCSVMHGAMCHSKLTLPLLAPIFHCIGHYMDNDDDDVERLINDEIIWKHHKTLLFSDCARSSNKEFDLCQLNGLPTLLLQQASENTLPETNAGTAPETVVPFSTPLTQQYKMACDRALRLQMVSSNETSSPNHRSSASSTSRHSAFNKCTAFKFC